MRCFVVCMLVGWGIQMEGPNEEERAKAALMDSDDDSKQAVDEEE